ncbi:MAG TPA: SAP domain-containing protein [Nocardioides sp.]
MSARELQQACRDRGLPTARDKDTMVARLMEADATPAETTNTSDQPEPVLSVADPASLVPVTPAVHRETFPARDGGPGDDEHAACRTATIAAAQAHGYTPMGDAHRVATVDGMWVYEVHLRRGLA